MASNDADEFIEFLGLISGGFSNLFPSVCVFIDQLRSFYYSTDPEITNFNEGVIEEIYTDFQNGFSSAANKVYNTLGDIHSSFARKLLQDIFDTNFDKLDENLIRCRKALRGFESAKRCEQCDRYDKEIEICNILSLIFNNYREAQECISNSNNNNANALFEQFHNYKKALEFFQGVQSFLNDGIKLDERFQCFSDEIEVRSFETERRLEMIQKGIDEISRNIEFD